MDKYEWLLFVHVTGAFLLLSGAVAVGAIQLATLRRERPSEIALLLNLTRIPEVAVDIGALLVLVFGIWLAHFVGYGFGQTWIVAALVLWVASMALGGIGGVRYKRARLEAQRLAAADDRPTPDLERLVHDRVAFLLSWASGLAVLGILALMVWKPGA